ncbi:hypothetical protein QKT49_gp118 [Acanthamoeba castellanii medusavirus]|uniref:Uncharacterized protein n=1 Tax=Acanthamoeba castellanii medusavirus J1 TaxID=3114988 RepID=A0A3T1CWR3_9VIRU|nr:hypothetical protein QKT49_gp118 [Acanthamoeba castellanii medusavirus]BBI30258.1 hypothetical protein [Acanthamoeba castellanii medusavirus J1]
MQEIDELLGAFVSAHAQVDRAAILASEYEHNVRVLKKIARHTAFNTGPLGAGILSHPRNSPSGSDVGFAWARLLRADFAGLRSSTKVVYSSQRAAEAMAIANTMGVFMVHFESNHRAATRAREMWRQGAWLPGVVDILAVALETRIGGDGDGATLARTHALCGALVEILESRIHASPIAQPSLNHDDSEVRELANNIRRRVDAFSYGDAWAREELEHVNDDLSRLKVVRSWSKP